ncbi:MAG: hypothetical protein SWZ49_00190 [Cyanobacteriota bacterium]|nr:hypothetical protein [Cyanobacteriota bacterium]
MISFKKIILGTAAISISFGSVINFQQPAEAGFLRKIEKGVRGVGRKIDPTNRNSIIRKTGRDIDPTKRRGSEESYCLAAIIDPTKYRLVNRTNKVVFYRLNGRSYKLAPTYQRVHKVGGGSNSCNNASHRAVVTFDSNTLKSGLQKATRHLNRGGLSKGYEYYFSSRSNGAYVRLVSRNLKTPLKVEGGKDTVYVQEPKKQQPKNTPPVESAKPPQPQPPVKEEEDNYYYYDW